MPVGAAIGISGVAGAAANVFAGNEQKKAADKASNVQKKMYAEMRSDLAPYRAAGVTGTNALLDALPELSSRIQFDNASLQQLPGYSFTLQQGLKSAQNSAAARGLGSSGAALKGASAYSTGLANQFANDAYNRELAGREQRFNALMGTSQLGANAAAQTGQGALNTGQQVANNLIGGAAAQGAGLVGAGNALMGAANTYGGYQLGQQQAQNMYAQNQRYGFGWPV